MAQLPVGSGWHLAKARRMAATLAFMQAVAGKGEMQMKSNAQWTDRTSLARGGLTGEATLRTTPILTTITAEFRHTMEYGRWLETIHGAAMGRRAGMSIDQLQDPSNIGPLAVIHPTVAGLIGEVRSGLVKIWS